jgi:3-methyladenine DNA glycosylase/8-oxoguanine DNA glycosylase
LLELTLALNGKARTIEIGPGKRSRARVTVLGRAPSGRTADELVARVRHVLALDEDLSDFYELVAGDPDLSWASAGAGRMLRAPSVYEDVIKTRCTQPRLPG